MQIQPNRAPTTRSFQFEFLASEDIDAEHRMNKASEPEHTGRNQQAKSTTPKKVPTRPNLDILADEDYDDELEDATHLSPKNTKR